MKRLRIGSSTNLAAIAAAIVIPAENMKTRSQLPPAASTEASGTSS
ncbi:MAG: hypothetical protein JWR56_1441, partial [Massilia sp.]|nr:hypothetical protein [Massilia sp.]